MLTFFLILDDDPMQTEHTALFNEAKKYIPGGVNSPVRDFSGVGGTPVFFEKAQGAYLFDTNQKKYIAYINPHAEIFYKIKILKSVNFIFDL